MTFLNELETLINKYSKENDSNTPDFILAEYLNDCLEVYNKIILKREKWYGREIPLSTDQDPLDLEQKIQQELWIKEIRTHLSYLKDLKGKEAYRYIDSILETIQKRNLENELVEYISNNGENIEIILSCMGDKEFPIKGKLLDTISHLVYSLDEGVVQSVALALWNGGEESREVLGKILKEPIPHKHLVMGVLRLVGGLK